MKNTYFDLIDQTYYFPQEGFDLNNGNLTFHGVAKTIENIPITIDKIGDKIIIKGSFRVLASDFKIDIPKIVRNKIAEYILVSFSFELLKK